MPPDLTWRKPSRCESGHCVLVAVYPNAVYVRDGKLDPSPVLHYTPDQWRQLLGRAREDRWLDDVWLNVDDSTIAWGESGKLWFTPAEIDAWIAAAIAGEFDLPEVTR